MSLRIRLVEPRPAGHNVYDRALLPRLGLPLMGAMLARAGHDVRAYCEVLAPVDVEDLLGAEFVGISSTTATAPAAYRLADLLGEAGVPVVLGGPHVTFCADEALAHAPYVVRGEGEATMSELAGSLKRGRPLDGLAGLSYRDCVGEPRHNAGRPRCSQAGFEALPAPDLSLVVGHEAMTTKPLMTQWGCPFDCEFCSVTAMFSRAVRHRRTDQVLAELAGLDADSVFFYDDNFVVNKARTTELMRAMRDAGLTPSWYAQVRADATQCSVAHPEIDHGFLGLMRDSGCEMVMVGIEAITDEGLAAIGKKLRVASVESAVAGFHEHGIAVHGMFVAGLDTDTAASAEATAGFARRIGIDTFQLMVETPLPGTRLWSRTAEAERLVSNDWSLYDGHHVVMRPAQMTPLELQLGVLEAMRRFYSWPSILASGALGVLRHLPDLGAALSRPAFVRRLPAVARAAAARRFDDVMPLLDGRGGPRERGPLRRHGQAGRAALQPPLQLLLLPRQNGDVRPGREVRDARRLLEVYVRSTIAASPGPFVHFVWHGGESTLAGVGLYCRALELQRRHLPDGWTLVNNLQTNGTLLDDAWCAFPRREPLRRRDQQRRPGATARRLPGLRRLRAHGIEPDAFCTLNDAHPVEVYRSFLEEHVTWLQFLPVVVREARAASRSHRWPPSRWASCSARSSTCGSATTSGGSRCRGSSSTPPVGSLSMSPHSACFASFPAGTRPTVEARSWAATSPGSK